jgi:putative cell wall-binding protein
VPRRLLALLLALLLAALGVQSVAAPAGAAGEADDEERTLLGYPVRAAAVVPNDPAYAQQWGPKKIGMEEAWADTSGSANTVIAVLDTGVKADGTYPDLNGRVLPGWDFVDNDSNPDDENDTGTVVGHGTMVSLIAVAPGNGAGMVGHCWQCRILPVRVLDAAGRGYTNVVADGIDWAVAQGADVINLSLTSDVSPPDLTAAVENAQSHGIPVVAAAGNFYDDPDTPEIETPDLTAPQYPAALPGVVSVAATDMNDAVYWWSFRGASWVRTAGPGCVFGNEECGTSFASPAIAGVLALGQAVAPCITDDRLTTALYDTSAPVTGGGVEHGRVDAAPFVKSILASEPATRLAGSSRIMTAVSVSRRAYVSAPAVVLARADNYADALAAAPLAAKVNGPVLLTPQSGLDRNVASEIERLGATDVWLAGGEAALGPGVVSDLNGEGFTDGHIHRRFGGDRYATAAAIGQEVGGSTVYIASSLSFADGVAVSGLAAYTQSPILLVRPDVAPQATLDALDALDPAAVHLVGGVNVISEPVKQQLEAATSLTIDRISGDTRYDTSEAVGVLAREAGLDPKNVWVATGVNWPDALAAGPAAAKNGGVLLLADASAAMIKDWIATESTTSVKVAGGQAAVSDATVCSVEALL